MNSHDNNELTKPRPNPVAGVKRAIFALGIVVIVWFVFGQVVPRLFFEAESPVAPAIGTQTDTQRLADQQAMRALEERVAQLEAKVKTYEELLSTPKAESQATPTPETSEQLMAWQASMEEKLAALETAKAQPTPVDDARLAALEARISNQQQAFATIQMQADEKIALTAALAQLKERLLAGRSYNAPLASVAALTATREELKPLLLSLSRHSETGLTTPDESRRTFEAALTKVLENNDKTSLIGNVRSLVSIRKVGEPEGTTDEAILARAETKLNRGDMEGTLAELSALSESAAVQLQSWSNAARAFQQAKADLAALEIAAFKPVQQAPQEPAP